MSVFEHDPDDKRVEFRSTHSSKLERTEEEIKPNDITIEPETLREALGETHVSEIARVTIRGGTWFSQLKGVESQGLEGIYSSQNSGRNERIFPAQFYLVTPEGMVAPLYAKKEGITLPESGNQLGFGARVNLEETGPVLRYFDLKGLNGEAVHRIEEQVLYNPLSKFIRP